MSDQPIAFFLFSDGELHVESDVDRAAGFMEPIDVMNGEYDAVFDDAGRRYEFKVVGRTTQLEFTGDVDLVALREWLRELGATDAYRSLEGFDPDQPLRAAAAVSRSEWEHRWPRRPRWLSRRPHGTGPTITA